MADTVFDPICAILWLKYSAKAGMSDKLIMVYLLIYYSLVDNGIIAV
ncbi:MAG: hypothetical protein ACLS9K_03420 [Lachnospira eligens]